MINRQNRELPEETSSPEQKPDLLEAVRRHKACLGEGLNDTEFSRFLQAQNLPPEEGFAFLCFCEGFLTLSVPRQDEQSWHADAGWIAPAKEKTAIEFAERHGFLLNEPPDTLSGCHTAGAALVGHHHLQFSNRKEPVIIAHPNFLKVRLFTAGHHMPVPWNKEILHELSALYPRC